MPEVNVQHFRLITMLAVYFLASELEIFGYKIGKNQDYFGIGNGIVCHYQSYTEKPYGCIFVCPKMHLPFVYVCPYSCLPRLSSLLNTLALNLFVSDFLCPNIHLPRVCSFATDSLRHKTH